MMKKFSKILIISLVAAFTLGLAGIIMAATTVNMGTADSYAVLAGSTITNTGSSVITGDLGLSPGTSITGFPPGVLHGTQHLTDASALQAKTDLATAYGNAAGQGVDFPIVADLGGRTLVPGVYNSASSISITGKVTLDAAGDPNAVFIFQAGSTLTTAGASEVSLINGAQSCHVFWQVGSSATLGTYSTFKGNILALTSATLTTGANVEGSVLARSGAVTLDSNIINKVACGVVPPVVTFVPVPAAPAAVSNYFSALPLINITKIPNPLTLPNGPGSVAYTYAATNIGPVPMSNVWVKDNKCDPVTFISGDTNNDSKLDKDESWIYRCSKIVSQTETNTATARGFYNGWDAYDTVNATVAVGVLTPPPLIHLVKIPSVTVLPAGGGAVTYVYIVTNPGVAPLSDVSITDNKCTGLPGRVVGHPGDINKNNLLDPGEAWQFTCKTNIAQTTTNIGTAEGHANGLTAIDFSPATVAVASPGLPNTGFGPNDKSFPWSFAIPAGAFAVAILFYFARRKQMV